MLNRKADARLTNQNPVKVTPFFERNDYSGFPSPPADDNFQFLDGDDWLLLDGTNFDLLE
jgi:hypothetical protein